MFNRWSWFLWTSNLQGSSGPCLSRSSGMGEGQHRNAPFFSPGLSIFLIFGSPASSLPISSPSLEGRPFEFASLSGGTLGCLLESSATVIAVWSGKSSLLGSCCFVKWLLYCKLTDYRLVRVRLAPAPSRRWDCFLERFLRILFRTLFCPARWAGSFNFCLIP